MIDLLKLTLILGLTIVLLVFKWDLGLILLLNAGVVAVLFAYPPLALLISMLQGLVALDTLQLAGAVFLVLMLAQLMRRTDSMQKMVRALQIVVPDSRVVLALMPAMIGLMPMLGGAMFSAPMVNEIGTRLDLAAYRKTFINYWFRHSMEYVFPLYSSILMVAALLGVSIYEFIRVSWPLTLAAVLGGIIWGLIGVQRHETVSHQSGESGRYSVPRSPSIRRAWVDLLGSTWPLLLVILAVVVFQFNMLISLSLVIVLFIGVKLGSTSRGSARDRIGPAAWGDLVKSSFPIPTFSAIFGVMIFKHVLEDAGAVERIPLALSGLGLPPLLVAFVVPMVIGLLTGTAPATMALSVPLVSPLLAPLPIEYIASGVWMFVGGFSGIMLSPMHLCLALTREYFDASWGRLYSVILPSVGLVVAAALGIVLLR